MQFNNFETVSILINRRKLTNFLDHDWLQKQPKQNQKVSLWQEDTSIFKANRPCALLDRPSVNSAALFMLVTNSDFSENVNREYLVSLHLTLLSVWELYVMCSTRCFTIDIIGWYKWSIESCLAADEMRFFFNQPRGSHGALKNI